MSDHQTTNAEANTKGHQCGICGQHESQARLLENCSECDVTFHLNPRNDVEGIDCGDAVIGPELGVYFFCQNCIDRSDDQARQELPTANEASVGNESSDEESGSALPSTSDIVTDAPARVRRTRGRRRYRRVDGS